MERLATDHELGQFIPLHYHFNMLDDVARTGAFEEAIAHTVRPGARVLELGGGTGVVSFFAAREAGHVWCVERNPELAPAELAQANRQVDVSRGTPGGKRTDSQAAGRFDRPILETTRSRDAKPSSPSIV